jgi:hypothetical protein
VKLWEEGVTKKAFKLFPSNAHLVSISGRKVNLLEILKKSLSSVEPGYEP